MSLLKTRIISMKMIQQGTPEWMAQRAGRITGSRIGTILGLSPWQKPSDIIRQMVREHHGAEPEFTGNVATDYGKAHESQAMLAFMRVTGLMVEKCGFFEYGDRMGASPDGLTSDGGVLELKCPYGLRKGGEFKPLSEQPHYAAQVQLEMLAAGRNHAYFAQYRPPVGDPLSFDYMPEDINIERVDLDQDWIDSVWPLVSEFYAKFLSELDNPEHLEPIRIVIDDQKAANLVLELDVCRKHKKVYDEREKAIIEELVKISGGKNADINGRKLTKVVRKGNVKYQDLLKEICPDLGDAGLDKWRGKASESWRLS